MTLRIAVPNKGSLSQAATEMLRESGYRQRHDAKELTLVDTENDVEFYYLRPRDIAVYVGEGTLDVGVTGRDLLLDSGAKAEEVLSLGFGRSRFLFAGPVGEYTEVGQLAGKRIATPLLAVVVAIEAADLVFAVDSVPAVLAVSDNTFIIYASNAFAILGLRALYFLLAGMLKKFHYLGKGLAFILAFIGVKLFLQAGHKVISPSIPEIPSLASLAVIVAVLAGSIGLSLARPLPPEEQTTPDATGIDEADAPTADEHSQR